VFQAVFARDVEARERGICLLPGVGFDVVPTDCLAKHVADRLPGATALEIAFAALGRASVGTVKSALGILAGGFKRRAHGELVAADVDTKRIRFSDRERESVLVPWGDLVTAYRSTGIADIAVYIGLPRRLVRWTRVGGPAVGRVLRIEAVRRAAALLADKVVTGPSSDARARGRSLVWARAIDRSGGAAEAWLEAVEGYRFTALASVRAAERTLEASPVGALTPSLAFGADFALEIEGTRRLDALG
jgi:short subunit dehydrogenase-like uncharacterized protein